MGKDDYNLHYRRVAPSSPCFRLVCIFEATLLSESHYEMATAIHEFYFFIWDDSVPKETKITRADMLLVGTCQLRTAMAIDVYHQQVSDEFNSRLRKFLVKNNIRQFVPKRRPTIETDARGTVSICYYHNKLQYDIIYSAFPDYIMSPVAPLMERLDELYEAHGLEGWYDSRSNVTVGTDGESVQTSVLDVLAASASMIDLGVTNRKKE